MYEPRPVDTSNIQLPDEIVKLTEQLAENNHDLWAQQRMAEGWTYGPERDDANKKHPDLVPYGDLPESEKEYDRRTAMETLKTIMALGYQIESPPKAPLPFLHEEAAWAMRRLRDPVPLDLAVLHAIWRGRSPERWAGTPEIYRLLGERILGIGEPLLAYDVLSEGLEHWPRDVRLRQLLALALARSGATYRANKILHRLHEEGQTDKETLEETLGILARTHKDFWALATDPAEKERQLRLAYEFYYEAYRSTRGYYTGINAATLALLRGDREDAYQLGREVRALCLEELQRLARGGGDAYWAEATLGEAALILSEWTEAEEWYTKAAKTGQGRFADLSSTRRQARLLMEHLGGDKHRFDRCFGIPRIVIFAGHLIDQPGHTPSRFPPSLEGKVRQEIRARLEQLDAGIGYASAACGSDLLFLEAMLERGGEINVVLPFPEAEFRQVSVDLIPGAEWGKRFDEVLKRAANVYTVSEYSSANRSVI